jgi:hypothetical protein
MVGRTYRPGGMQGTLGTRWGDMKLNRCQKHVCVLDGMMRGKTN